jgi:biopolymer transport protein ExbD
LKIDLPPTAKPRIEMLPLIDVVFLLLVVFIYAMLSMAVHRGMPVRLPGSSTAVVDRADRLSITVDREGRVYVDHKAVALAQLHHFLQRESNAGPSTQVMIFGDRDLAYQRLFAVLDQCRKAGIHRISLQADSATAP